MFCRADELSDRISIRLMLVCVLQYLEARFIPAAIAKDSPSNALDLCPSPKDRSNATVCSCLAWIPAPACLCPRILLLGNRMEWWRFGFLGCALSTLLLDPSVAMSREFGSLRSSSICDLISAVYSSRSSFGGGGITMILGWFASGSSHGASCIGLISGFLVAFVRLAIRCSGDFL